MKFSDEYEMNRNDGVGPVVLLVKTGQYSSITVLKTGQIYRNLIAKTGQYDVCKPVDDIIPAELNKQNKKFVFTWE